MHQNSARLAASQCTQHTPVPPKPGDGPPKPPGPPPKPIDDPPNPPKRPPEPIDDPPKHPDNPSRPKWV